MLQIALMTAVKEQKPQEFYLKSELQQEVNDHLLFHLQRELD